MPQLSRDPRRRTLDSRPRPPALGDGPREKSSATVGRAKKSKSRLTSASPAKAARAIALSVDVATYKAEFLSHYHEGRLRPLSDYAFGNIDFWARLASNAPGLVNLTTQLPFLRDIAKVVAGIPQQRSIPAFAPETFKAGSAARQPAVDAIGRRASSAPTAPVVLLWPDTFNNYFLPNTAQGGRRRPRERRLPRRLARRQSLLRTPALRFRHARPRRRPAARRSSTRSRRRSKPGFPIVGLEPSCVAVFRDELCNLFPRDERAQRLSRQTVPAQRVSRELPRVDPAPAAAAQGHRPRPLPPQVGPENERRRGGPDRIGLDFQTPAPGCCGMAGSFGFEHDKYDVSIAIGELELLPAVRRPRPTGW